MADIWRAVAMHVTYSSTVAKSAIDVSNGSSRVARVFRAWHTGSSTIAATGVVLHMIISRTSICTGLRVPTYPARQSQDKLPALMDAGSNRAYTETGVLRGYMHTNEEFAQTATPAISNWQFEAPWNLVWEAGSKDTRIEPITLRQGQGFHIRQETLSNIGHANYEIEFSNEAT